MLSSADMTFELYCGKPAPLLMDAFPRFAISFMATGTSFNMAHNFNSVSVETIRWNIVHGSTGGVHEVYKLLLWLEC